MPIRLRLTLWNCVIFGTIMAIVIVIIYFTHKQAHFKDVDRMLQSITSLVHEEINKELDEGKPLNELKISIDDLALNEMAVMVKNREGEIVAMNAHPFFEDHQLLADNKPPNFKGIQTFTDNQGTRIRVQVSPIHQNGDTIGYVETLYSFNNLEQTLMKFRLMVIGIAGIGIILALFAGWLLAKKTLSRVDLVRKTAKSIAASQDFEQRVMHNGPADELGKLSETFNHMLDSLEKAYVNQKRFLSDASHELRAPLTTIRGNLDILHKIKAIPESEKEEIIDDIRNEAIRMSKLVSDLLSLARADAGQLFHKEVIDLSAVAKGVLTEIDSWEKKVNVETRIEKKIMMWGEAHLIKQLLIILLDNAIKYTPAGGTVFFTAETENGQAAVRIRDTGIGIEEDELPFVFERFYRTKSARSYTNDGTGLGLSIAKWIVEDHGGKIVLSSQPRTGTEFTIYFPLIR